MRKPLPSFVMRDRKHKPLGMPAEYRPLTVVVGDVRHTFALHQQHGWSVSDPASGARLLTVDGRYRGIRVSSTAMGPPEATQRARQQVVALTERVGIPQFNDRLTLAREAAAQADAKAAA